MKISLACLILIAFTGCASRTPQGDCVGLNGTEKPNLEYKYNGWNIGIAILFSGLIIPPVVVALDELKCPVGPKEK